MQAIILAAGMGKRLGEFTKENTKCMVEVNGTRLIDRVLGQLSRLDLNRVVIVVGYEGKKLMDYVGNEYNGMPIEYVSNPIYDKTNYIYSMYLARDLIDDDMLFFHGDLVFNRKLIHDVLKCEDKNTATVNFKKALPEKDFKGRIKDGKVMEVSIKIFDEDCFAFQPFYKLEKATAAAWVEKVVEFINKGEDKCYAENALNEIFPELNIRAFSYDGYYIDEIDNLDDHARVTADIIPFDEADEKIFNS